MCNHIYNPIDRKYYLVKTDTPPWESADGTYCIISVYRAIKNAN